MLNLLRPSLSWLFASASFYPCCCGPKGGPSGGSSFPGGSSPPNTGSSFGSSGSDGPAAEDDGPPRGSGSGGLGLCDGFINSSGPAVIRVDVQGVQGMDCSDCNLLNGSYYCEIQVGIWPARLCTWALHFEGLCNDEYSLMELILRETLTPGRYHWTVALDGKLVIGSEALSIVGTIDSLGGDRMTIAEIDGLVLDQSPGDTFNTECRWGASPQATLYPVT